MKGEKEKEKKSERQIERECETQRQERDGMVEESSGRVVQWSNDGSKNFIFVGLEFDWIERD